LGLCLNLPPYASNRRPSPWKVAKELGIDGKTVKARMKKWEKTGFIKYYQVIPNYNLLGIKSAYYMLSPGDVLKKYEVLKKIHLVEGVLSIVNFVGDKFLVTLDYEKENEMNKRAELLGEIAGCGTPSKLMDEPFDPIGIQLSGLDWQIIRCLRNRALKPFSMISKECGFTSRTVKSHLERMVDKEAFFIKAVFDMSRVTGLVFYSVALIIEPNQRRSASDVSRE